MIRYTNIANYNYKAVRNEINTLPSETVPNETMTIRQILERHVSGLAMPKERSPIYHDETEDMYVPDPRTLDLVDIQELAEKNDQMAKDFIRDRTYRMQELAKKQKAEYALQLEELKTLREYKKSKDGQTN